MVCNGLATSSDTNFQINQSIASGSWVWATFKHQIPYELTWLTCMSAGGQNPCSNPGQSYDKQIPPSLLYHYHRALTGRSTDVIVMVYGTNRRAWLKMYMVDSIEPCVHNLSASSYRILHMWCVSTAIPVFHKANPRFAQTLMPSLQAHSIRLWI